MGRLERIPLDLDEANAFIDQHHRHHGPVVGHKFSIGAVKDGRVVGVVVIGRPVAQMRQDGLTLELTRLCTDGTRNAASFLLGSACRAVFALGYRRLGTYTLKTETGTSLVAAGWRIVAETKGGSWARSGRPRVDRHPTQPKLRWEPTAVGGR